MCSFFFLLIFFNSQDFEGKSARDECHFILATCRLRSLNYMFLCMCMYNKRHNRYLIITRCDSWVTTFKLDHTGGHSKILSTTLSILFSFEVKHMHEGKINSLVDILRKITDTYTSLSNCGKYIMYWLNKSCPCVFNI